MLMSLWKEYFSWPKLVFLLAVLVPCSLYMALHYNLIFYGAPIIKQIVVHKVAAEVKLERIESEVIKEKNKTVSLQCYIPYCGLTKEGKYILSEIKYIIFHDQVPLSRGMSSKDIYYLSHICLNKKNCFDNNITNILNKKKSELIGKARFGAFFWLVSIILIIVIPYGNEIKNEAKIEIERRYGIR